MNLLGELASSSSALLFGPPAPVAKDPPPPPKRTAMTASRKAALLKPNLGLAEQAQEGTKDEAPLPVIPETENKAASVLVSTGASALSFLGSTVVSLTSAAALALVSPHPAAETGSANTAAPGEKEGGTVLGTLSSAVFSSAASVRDMVLGSADATSTNDAGKDSAPPRVKRASTLPVQLTATGEPFSDDPSVSAMQRIPDHPCGHVAHHKLTHCCSAPAIPTTACTCTCSTTKDPQCECDCHLNAANARRDSGHFHRVEQLVKGTKRVVRDIRNVL
ncbi:uncharacterized protein PAN0_024d6130 [Moesziomyces antarcticus]|uniref:Uncharacterized protein n=2 Tax=Pseudozyma antarctica TaxID=84753 RepID=A0A081CMK4_PSEA2|nr:uncharacterized protein PAN0_024d6130 [Moesziomyces antarcticus]GAK67900.1 conserved hypothetical protein [Moesziomyces antarcticus]SPO47345.1 uncharacterized protein PSANT_05033 [Moesziomyces antarcticus]